MICPSMKTRTFLATKTVGQRMLAHCRRTNPFRNPGMTEAGNQTQPFEQLYCCMNLDYSRRQTRETGRLAKVGKNYTDHWFFGRAKFVVSSRDTHAYIHLRRSSANFFFGGGEGGETEHCNHKLPPPSRVVCIFSLPHFVPNSSLGSE